MAAEVKDIAKMLTWVTGSATSSKTNPAAEMNLDDIAKKIGELRPQLADILDDLEANPRSEDFGLSFLGFVGSLTQSVDKTCSNGPAVFMDVRYVCKCTYCVFGSCAFEVVVLLLVVGVIPKHRPRRANSSTFCRS